MPVDRVTDVPRVTVLCCPGCYRLVSYGDVGAPVKCPFCQTLVAEGHASSWRGKEWRQKEGQGG